MNITDIPGVFGSATCCGIKEGRDDLCFIYVPSATASAATFTKNHFRAPCVDYAESCFLKGTVKAVVVNAGNANAATGKKGFENAEQTSVIAAGLLSLEPREVAVASTGIIGKQLPMDKISKGLEKLLADPRKRNGDLVAKSILTTDLREKSVYFEEQIGGKKVLLAGIAKGSGMIAPNMATMLAFLATNAAIPEDVLKVQLREAVSESFNMITVDSDTSTNDLVMLFASGEESVPLNSTNDQQAFLRLLKRACIDLAKLIVIDGEGATKLIEVQVHGAASISQARTIALAIANSPLVKTAIHGADPNWGRVVMAVGKSPEVRVNPEIVDLFFGQHQVLARGEIVSFNRDALIKYLKQAEVTIRVNLNLGDFSATAWGCDLTKAYIDINTQYS